MQSDKPKIIVVDDEDFMREMISTWLEVNIDYEIITFNSPVIGRQV